MKLRGSSCSLNGELYSTQKWESFADDLYRLKKTGVVNIKNPVEQAVEDGRFEELD